MYRSKNTYVNKFKFISTPKISSYIYKSMTYRYNVAHGTIRSGKDYMSVPAFIERIKTSNESLFLVASANTDRAYKIVGQLIIDYCGGLALKQKVDESNAIVFRYKNKHNTIMFVNGYNKNSQDFIQGLTIGGLYMTEVNLLDKDFVAQAINRIASVDDPFVFMTANPKGPKHWFYTDFLNIWLEESKSIPNYLNLTNTKMEDNPIMSKKKIELAKLGRDPNSVAYKRDILGLVVDPEGAVYTIKDSNILRGPINYQDYQQYVVVMDPGQSISATVFLLGAITLNPFTRARELHFIKGYKHLNALVSDFAKLSDLAYYDEYKNFIKNSIELFQGKHPKLIMYDGTDATFRELKLIFNQEDLGQHTPKYVIKDKELERITRGQNWLHADKVKIHESLDFLLDDLKNSVYDDKAADKGEVRRYKSYNKDGHFDSLDCFDYICSYYASIKFII